MKIYLASEKSCLYVALIIMLAAISRLCVMFFSQAEAGDTATYIKFAENIIRGCGLSHSDPSSNECILTSGGYFPGYPAFIASVWMIFGKSVLAVLISQLICYLLALTWLLIAIFRLTKSNKIIFALGILLALSPLQIGWFRFILTEPLAIASSTWFLAELIISVADKKLRIFHLASALSISIFIRPDGIFMVLGVFLVSFHIYDFKKSIRQILVILLLTTVPVSGWIIRNYNIGQPLLSLSSGGQSPPGYFMWLSTWVVNEYERSEASSPVWLKNYSQIKIHNSKYMSDDELIKTQLLIRELSKLDGQKFPENIDEQFNNLALKKIQNRSSFMLMEIYSARVIWLLLNPFSSWGLPLEIKDVDRGAVSKAIRSFELIKVKQLLSGHDAVIYGKIASFTYRLLLFLTFFLFMAFAFNRLKPLINSSIRAASRILILACSLVMAARLTFFVITWHLESRYFVVLVPWIECCCVLCFFYMGRSGFLLHENHNSITYKQHNSSVKS